MNRFVASLVCVAVVAAFVAPALACPPQLQLGHVQHFSAQPLCHQQAFLAPQAVLAPQAFVAPQAVYAQPQAFLAAPQVQQVVVPQEVQRVEVQVPVQGFTQQRYVERIVTPVPVHHAQAFVLESNAVAVDVRARNRRFGNRRDDIIVPRQRIAVDAGPARVRAGVSVRAPLTSVHVGY